MPNLNKKLWKLKAPVKIKVFLWYLGKGVILTKDNLAKRNWQGDKTCCYCHEPETIRHLFFDCRSARMVWNLIHLATDISSPTGVENMFGSWLTNFDNHFRALALLGAASTVWSIWQNRNDIVFEKKLCTSPLQVIFTIIHWLRIWATLQREDMRHALVEATQHLAQVAKDFFLHAHGWRSSRRIDSH